MKLPIHRNSKLYKLLYSYFKDDLKISLWFIINNPELNGMKPEIYLSSQHLKNLLIKKVKDAIARL